MGESAETGTFGLAFEFSVNLLFSDDDLTHKGWDCNIDLFILCKESVKSFSASEGELLWTLEFLELSSKSSSNSVDSLSRLVSIWKLQNPVLIK